MNFTSRELKGWSSYYLDFVRISAAYIVFVSHAIAAWNPIFNTNPLIEKLSHNAVVVFFVLSGFVICHTTLNKKRDFASYFSARFSRLYSIFFWAIILTGIVALYLSKFSPGFLNQYDQGNIFGINYFINYLVE